MRPSPERPNNRAYVTISTINNGVVTILLYKSAFSSSKVAVSSAQNTGKITFGNFSNAGIPEIGRSCTLI